MICADIRFPLQSIDFEEGCIIPVDKETGWTSFDVVNKLRYTIRVKKVGHAGTLDPLATGLLLVCCGKYTKKLDQLTGMDKEYTGTIILGKTSPSYDLETELTISGDPTKLDNQEISGAVEEFIGELDQVPPPYSAIRVNGVRAYKKARKNETTSLRSRKVLVHEFELTRVKNPEIEFRLVCSKGTYIRSIAHDFGAKLGTGAYLASLRRTRIGPYKLDEAWKIKDFVEAYNKMVL